MKNVFNKLVVVGAVVLLISICASAAIKFGTDPTGQRWYGPTGDLITCSNGKAFAATGAGFQSAIYSLNGTGGTVYLPVMNISLATTFYLNEYQSGITITGQGNKTIFYSPAASDTFIFRLQGTSAVQPINNVTIEKITFNGNKANQVTDGHALYIRNANDIFIKDCIIRNTWNDGIQTTPTATHVVVEDCQFYDCGSTLDAGAPAGILFQGSYNIVKNCYFKDCLAEGIAFDPGVVGLVSRGNIVTGNMITGNTGHGIHLETSRTLDTVVSDNIIYNLASTYFPADGGSTGITAGGTNNVISNNIIHHVQRNGISVTDYTSYRNIVEGNNIYNIRTSVGDGGRGILNAGANKTIITNNIINNTLGSGIEVELSSNVSITGNMLVNCNLLLHPSYAAIDINQNTQSHLITGNNIISGYNGIINVGYSFVDGNKLYNVKGIDLSSGISGLNNFGINSNNTKLLDCFSTQNLTSNFPVGFSWYSVTTHKLYVYEGAGVWKSSTFT